MKTLIIRTDIDETASSRSLTGIDSAITMELYHYKSRMFKITANHLWDKYTYFDEDSKYIGTFKTMDSLISFLGTLTDCRIISHDVWLNKVCPDWTKNPRYKYY